MLYLPFKKPFNQLYITNNMERISFKCGRACASRTLQRQTGLQCYSKNSGLILLLSLKYLSIERVKPKNKFVCIAMCSLVMSLCSRDVITIH